MNNNNLLQIHVDLLLLCLCIFRVSQVSTLSTHTDIWVYQKVVFFSQPVMAHLCDHRDLL